MIQCSSAARLQKCLKNPSFQTEVEVCEIMQRSRSVADDFTLEMSKSNGGDWTTTFD